MGVREHNSRGGGEKGERARWLLLECRPVGRKGKKGNAMQCKISSRSQNLQHPVWFLTPFWLCSVSLPCGLALTGAEAVLSAELPQELL